MSTQNRSTPELVEQARVYATTVHSRIDHRRKYSNQPYQKHLESVVKIVSSVSDDAEMLAAAWLHDTVEDTPATLEDLEQHFGAPP
jgi:(p)ppGpp synthase/HD superfamily hydrolase